MQADPRKDYLSRCALESLGVNGTSGRWARPASELTAAFHVSSELSNFLETSSVATLQVSVVPSKEQPEALDLTFSNSAGLAADSSGGVAFTKSSSQPLTTENISTSVLMNTLSSSPLLALQLQIKQLYAPILLQDPHWAGQLNLETQQTLEALDAALSSAVQRGSTAVRPVPPPPPPPLLLFPPHLSRRYGKSKWQVPYIARPPARSLARPPARPPTRPPTRLAHPAQRSCRALRSGGSHLLLTLLPRACARPSGRLLAPEARLAR